MATSKVWPSTGATNVTSTSYSIPQAGNVNWASLTDFLVALANGAQATTFQRFALRVAQSTPVTVSINDCIVQTNLTVPGAVAVTLPAGVQKYVYFISDGLGDAGTNNITITPNAGETIGGASTYVIDSDYGGVMLSFQSSDNDWKVVYRVTPNGTIIPSQITLANGKILVGDVTNHAAAQSMSGDITIDNAGVTAISAGVIVNADVNASAAIVYSKLDLTGGITNTDVNASAAIAVSKLAALTASRAIVSDGSGFISAATTTATEIGYVNGVTSSIQTQLDAKASNPTTTTGDIIYASATGTPGTLARLGIGSSNTVLQVSAGIPSWGLIANSNIASAAAIAVNKLAALSASVAVVTDASGFLTSASTTATQIGYLSAATGTTGTTSTNLVFSTSPTLVTPTLGVASATSINKVTITAPASSATLTIADGKTFTVSNTLTFTGTDTNSFAFPSGSSTVMTLASVDTITGAKTFNDGKLILAGSTSGTSTLKAQATAGTTTFTLPTTTGTLVGSGDTGTVTSTMILDGTILNADINASAAIAGTKISPDFGSQNITTSGNISTTGTGTLSVGGTTTLNGQTSAKALILANNGATTGSSDWYVGSKSSSLVLSSTSNAGSSFYNNIYYDGSNNRYATANQTGGIYYIANATALNNAVHAWYAGTDVSHIAGAVAGLNTVGTCDANGLWTFGTSGGTQTHVVNGQINLTGGQIIFPATQNPASNANTLDDYEEGAWTPAFTPAGGSGITYTTQVGRYTKIGNLVFAEAHITLSSLGTASGALSVTLPFSSANISNAYSTVQFSYWSVTTTSINNAGGYVVPNSTTLQVTRTTAAATAMNTSLSAADLSATSDLIFSTTYLTAT